MFRRISVFLMAIVLLCSCDSIDSMKEGFAHSQAVSVSLEKSIGLKSFVGFNWNNGSLTSVNVNFEGLPEQANLHEIAEASKQAILSEFKQTPKTIVISFSVDPG